MQQCDAGHPTLEPSRIQTQAAASVSVLLVQIANTMHTFSLYFRSLNTSGAIYMKEPVLCVRSKV